MDQPIADPVSLMAPVVYRQPSFENLKLRFPGHVSPDFEHRSFTAIDRCRNVPRKNREVAFEHVHLGYGASTEDVLAEMDRRILRPVLYEELLGFAVKYPGEQRKHVVVALGSVMKVRGYRCVACLWRNDSGRRIGLQLFAGGWYGFSLPRAVDGWHGSYRFLAVCK